MIYVTIMMRSGALIIIVKRVRIYLIERMNLFSNNE